MKLILIALISLNLIAERGKPLILPESKCELEKEIYQANYISCVNDGWYERNRLVDIILKNREEIKDLKRQVRQLKRKVRK